MCEDLIRGVTAVILAGGKGNRLGCNKALLRIGDTYLLEILVSNIKAMSDRILLVVSPYDYNHLLSIHSSLFFVQLRKRDMRFYSKPRAFARVNRSSKMVG